MAKPASVWRKSGDLPGQPTARLSGRKAVEQRKRRLAQEPLCRHCREQGRVTPAVTPDHITPLAFGGTDEDDNIQCLCDDCHAIKTAAEGAAYQGASNHPAWLERSAIPLTILSGPPCSGKTTYIANHAKPGDITIDLDTIMMRLQPGYQHWSDGLSGDLLNSAIRARNAMLGSLARKDRGRAWFIVSAPTQAERGWWQTKLGGEIILLHPGAAECKRRAIARGTPKAIKGVDEWERASRRPWSPERSAPQRTAIGEDGWPISPTHHWNAAPPSPGGV